MNAVVIVPVPTHPPRATCYCDTGEPVPSGGFPPFAQAGLGVLLGLLAVAFMVMGAGMAADAFDRRRASEALIKATAVVIASAIPLALLAAFIAWVIS